MPSVGRRSIWIARISTPAIRPLIKIVERRKTVDRQTKQDHRFFDGLVWFLTTTGNRFSHHNFFKLGLRISSINFSLKVVAVKSQLSPHKKVFGPHHYLLIFYLFYVIITAETTCGTSCHFVAETTQTDIFLKVF